MLLGAVVAAGVEVGTINGELRKLGVDGWALRAEAVSRAGIAAVLAHVDLAEAPQPHRKLPDILNIIDASSFEPRDKDTVSRVFRRLAEAEARVHGTSPDEIDFHEVGALDAIIDVCGAVIGLRLLGVERLYCSPLPAGGGTAKSRHGALPVPAPATLELIALASAPVAGASADRPMELVTPTGAAIVTTLAEFTRPPMTVERVAYGAGGRNPDGWPNALRLWLGESADARPTMLLVETNIDDMNPELYGYVQEKLFVAGAADVWFQPVQMKKNRPGVMVSALCASEREDAIAAVLLRETSTLGLRVSPVTRHEAAREVIEFESSLGPAAVKVKRLPGEPPRVAPEYEPCRRLAEQHNLPLAEVYRRIDREALDHISKR
jgi:uncharacterized protein (TIGR00299 family) protein